MIRFQSLLILVFCAIGLLGPSLVQCAPIEAPGIEIYDAPHEQLSRLEGSDEMSKHTRSVVPMRSSGLKRRGWISSFNEIATTAKQIGNGLISGMTQVADTAQTGKELLADFTGLASDARSATDEIKGMAQEAITNIVKLPTALIVDLKDETKKQLEETLGSLTEKVSSKLPTIGGLDTVVSSALIHLKGTALNKLEDADNKFIAKLDAVKSHITESINGLFKAPANAITSFLKNVSEKDLQILTDKADDYITKVNAFCDTLGKFVGAVQNAKDAANADWTSINKAAKNIQSLVVSYTGAQENVATVEVQSELPEESRITAQVFSQLSTQRLHWLKVYMSLLGNLSKRTDETAVTQTVVEDIWKQQKMITGPGDDEDGDDEDGDDKDGDDEDGDDEDGDEEDCDEDDDEDS
ncbi:uncharacterized protein PFLUO_LOCUS2818 [Penicillium psychrofluorescens]|uniref:uncharacterized protein n=1 Tax=Penicillium psychrofluorescens TaxID=3158075 RepID=UPI003CCDDE7D